MTETTATRLFRLRTSYVKHGRLAYLGHLELIHTIERIVRRAGLPFAVTQGFSPHMRVGFTSALPVGTSSDAEYYDLFMTDYVPAPVALDALRASSPADLAPIASGYLDVRAPALTAEITRALYRIDLDLAAGLDVDADRLERDVSRLFEQGRIPYMRGKKEKELDLAGNLVSFAASQERPGRLALELDTRISNEGGLRPEILLAALDRLWAPAGSDFEGPIVSRGIQDFERVPRYSVCRTAQYAEDADGSLLSPLRTDEPTPAPKSVSSVPSL